eukprot:6792-Heterococcus_DN1.PRE.3
MCTTAAPERTDCRYNCLCIADTPSILLLLLPPASTRTLYCTQTASELARLRATAAHALDDLVSARLAAAQSEALWARHKEEANRAAIAAAEQEAALVQQLQATQERAELLAAEVAGAQQRADAATVSKSTSYHTVSLLLPAAALRVPAAADVARASAEGALATALSASSGNVQELAAAEAAQRSRADGFEHEALSLRDEVTRLRDHLAKLDDSAASSIDENGRQAVQLLTGLQQLEGLCREQEVLLLLALLSFNTATYYY